MKCVVSLMSEALRIEKKTIEDYMSLPEGTRAELINGVIYDMSPSPMRIHQRIVTKMLSKIEWFILSKSGKCEAYTAPFDVKLNDETIVQPDISVICDPEKLTERGCSGAPGLIIEITSSNYAHDYVRKLNLYFDSGVKEYWIVNPDKKNISVYLLSDGYSPDFYSFEDDVPVSIYNGELKLNISSMLD